MSPVVVVVLLLAGLSEAAGRILPLIARRPGVSRSVAVELPLVGAGLAGPPAAATGWSWCCSCTT